MSRADKQQRRARRKERKEGTRGNARHFFPARQTVSARGPERYRHLSYDISFDAMPSDEPPLPPDLSHDAAEELFNLSHADPQAAIPRLEQLIEKNPDSRTLMNWLSAAFARTGNSAQSDQITEQIYQRWPDYLFAKLNHGLLLLQRGELDAVKTLFDNKFDVKLLYPQRDQFHISEVLGMQYLAVQYYLRIGEYKGAQTVYKIMQQLAPDDERTLVLREAVEGSVLLQAARQILSYSLSRGVIPG